MSRSIPRCIGPHDAPIVVGDHTRLTHDTGWQATIPLEHTLDDLLDFWRDAVEREDDGSHS